MKKRKTKHNASQKSKHRPPSDPLIAPSVFEISRHLKSGKLQAKEMARPVKEAWRSGVPPELVPFVRSRSRSLKTLMEVLKHHRWLFWHRLVEDQFFHLQGIMYECAKDDPEYRNAPEYRDAHQALRGLLEARAQTFLGAPWRLVPPKGRKGRKRKDSGFNMFLLDEYNDVLGRLKQKGLKRPGDESPQAWVERVCAAVRHVWEECSLSKEFDLVSRKVRSLPLSRDTIRKWAGEAWELANSGLSFRVHLAYSVTGHRWNLDANKVRWKIQTVRKPARKRTRKPSAESPS